MTNGGLRPTSIPAWTMLSGAVAFYGLILILFMFFSDRVVDLKAGLIICASDCTDFDRLSSVIAGGEWFPRFSGDWHYGPMFRGYVMYVALLKAVGGAVWPTLYVALHAVIAVCAVGFATSMLARRRLISVPVALGFALLIANPASLIMSKYLLSDYMFSGIFLLALIAVATGLAERNTPRLAAGFGLALLALFVRPNGLFVLAVLIATAICFVAFRRVPRARAVPLAALGAILAGLVALLLAISLSAYIAADPAVIDALPGFLREYGEVALRHNVLGSDSTTWDARPGANLWTFPWHSYAYNDGSWTGILGSVATRATVLFQIVLPPYSGVHNLYRVLYYVPLYAMFTVFLVSALRDRGRERPAEALMAGMFLGYTLIFLAISPIEIRYRLPLEFVMIAGAACVGARLVCATPVLARLVGHKA